MYSPEQARELVKKYERGIKGSLKEQDILLKAGFLKKEEAIRPIALKTREEFVAMLFTPSMDEYIVDLEKNFKEIRHQLVIGCERAGLFEKKEKIYNFQKKVKNGNS